MTRTMVITRLLMLMLLLLLLSPALLLPTLSCGSKLDAVQGGSCAEEAGDSTYQGQIEQILEDYCTSCHASNKTGSARNGAPSGVDLDGFQNASRLGEVANARIQNETMPPSSTKVLAEEKTLFQCWIDQGKQER